MAPPSLDARAGGTQTCVLAAFGRCPSPGPAPSRGHFVPPGRDRPLTAAPAVPLPRSVVEDRDHQPEVRGPQPGTWLPQRPPSSALRPDPGAPREGGGDGGAGFALLPLCLHRPAEGDAFPRPRVGKPPARSVGDQVAASCEESSLTLGGDLPSTSKAAAGAPRGGAKGWVGRVAEKSLPRKSSFFSPPKSAFKLATATANCPTPVSRAPPHAPAGP